MKLRRVIALILMITILIGMPQLAEYVTATNATDKKEELESELDDANSEMDDIKDSQEQLEEEMAQVRDQLVDLLIQMDQLETDIAFLQGQVEKTQQELDDAREVQAQQYEAMLIRIQYMYENSTQNSLLEAIIGAESIADLLKRVEYVAAVQRADRELTKQYQASVDLVEDKQATLIVQMDEMLAMQEIFLGQKMEMTEMLASLGDMQSEYASQLAMLEEKAADYMSQIAEQEEIIRKEEEERKRIEEERRRAEEERKRREEEEKKKQEEANKNNNNNNNNTQKPENSSPEGEAIVAYALQFVGNPYVWGGNSLTNGCDCSGFVNLIYKHFGYSLPRYSMSFLDVGTPVSREDIQPGDIIIYEKHNGIGHVAIYIGNGKIVEAQSSKAGITAGRSVDCRGIAGIRRIVP